MRVLVLGAGVLGSYLAHSLIKAGNDVTMLARGKRFEQLNTNGLVIKHYFQKKTTVDIVDVISELKEDDLYDLIFVVMKYNQFPSIYSTLANNISDNIVLVGNNADPKKMESEIQKLSKSKKNIGFGFQTSAGMREDSGRVISIHGKGNVMFGDLNGDLSLQQTFKKAFGTHYKVKIERDIEAWLLTHYVFILPMNSLLYLNDLNTKKISKSKVDLNKMIEATDEGYKVLKENGVNITPVTQGKLISDYRKLYYFAMKIYFRLPMNKVVSGSFDEMVALYNDFQKLKDNTKVNIKNWNELEEESLKKYHINKI
ncbi:ketopantoate reductase family protein [Peribacillus frigoritolerans]